MYAYKCVAPLISPVISFFFNESLKIGIYPRDLKTSRIVPIPKVNKAKSLTDYRPISTICVLSKIFEKMMYKRLYAFLQKNSILVPFQFGFRTGSSTSDALLKFLESAYDSINRGNYLLTVLLDFSKAFDTVNHEIL